MATNQAGIVMENAQFLAVKGLIYIVNDPELLNRFMDLTGLAPGDLRNGAGEPDFLAGVLSFLMDHEAVLLAFAASTGISPQHVASAHLALSRMPAWDG
jgi:hypothetical protein